MIQHRRVQGLYGEPLPEVRPENRRQPASTHRVRWPHNPYVARDYPMGQRATHPHVGPPCSHLPPSTSVYGPFKRFYYAECAAYMFANTGKVVTRYQIAEMTCKAYMKSLTPVNITSGFRKAGIFPLNRTTVATEKLMPCEAFRDERPL